MLQIRVNWNSPNFPLYHVYSCHNYSVGVLEGGDMQLLLNGACLHDHDIRLSDGAEAYVTNAAGRTVDVIRTYKRNIGA